jgi:hypothetical protein
LFDRFNFKPDTLREARDYDSKMVSIVNYNGYEYYDKRSDFWRNYFENAMEYEEYLDSFRESNPKDVDRWIEAEKRIPELSDEQRKRLKGFNRELNVLIYSGVWCGDCVRQGPILKKIVEECDNNVNLRIIERDYSKELQDELRIVGALRVPMMVFLSEDFWEVARFGERTLSVYHSKAARDIGRGMDQGILSPGARDRAMEEWIDIFERVLIMLRLSPPLRNRHND